MLSTHILSEVEKLKCDQVIIINRGEVAAAGSMEELAQRSGRKSLEDVFMRIVEREEAVVV